MNNLPDWAANILFPLYRWAHIVGTTLLVGGILFFEIVVPAATADLKHEQSLAVFGRARWIFGRILWLSVWAILLTGGLSIWRLWPTYNTYDAVAGSWWAACKPWFFGHMGLGLLGMIMALRLTKGRRLLSHPLPWMQITLIVLLVAIFMACVSRHMGLRMTEWRDWSKHAAGQGESPLSDQVSTETVCTPAHWFERVFPIR